MKIRCSIVIEYNNKDNAQMVLRSTNVDDFNFVKARVNKNMLESTIETNSISSLIHTLDDYLACVSVAEKVVDKS